jgi:BirA family transcriptional regulator, biotin operon repressor / biotin---[acetyl-CoA-carboxylase] ligase
MALGPKAEAAGFRHLHLDQVGSTNEEALRRRADRLWVTAGEQTAGRGRRGRQWASRPGNLYASLLLERPSQQDKAAQLCFVAALAVDDAVRACCPAAAGALALKWPNDVLLDGAKVAGILIEAVHEGDSFFVVVGCGINVAHHPCDLPYRAAHLGELDPDLRPADVFSALSDSFALRLETWQQSGFAGIRADWLARAAGIGSPVLLRLPGADVDGVFEGLDADGHLILGDASGGRRSVAAGEIVLASQIPAGATP